MFKCLARFMDVSRLFMDSYVIFQVNGVVLYGRCHLNASATIKSLPGPIYKIVLLRLVDVSLRALSLLLSLFNAHRSRIVMYLVDHCLIFYIYFCLLFVEQSRGCLK